MTTQLSHKTVKIRKEHRCFACYRKSLIGTNMKYWACIYEGDFNAGYTCLTCQSIMDKCDPEDDGFPEGFVTEMLDKNQTPEQLLEHMNNTVVGKVIV